MCHKCSAKFYDFAKSEIDCPKCGAEIDLSKPAYVPPPVKSSPVAREVEAADSEVVPAAGDFESIEELDGDDDGIVEDLADDSSDDDNY